MDMSKIDGVNPHEIAGPPNPAHNEIRANPCAQNANKGNNNAVVVKISKEAMEMLDKGASIDVNIKIKSEEDGLSLVKKCLSLIKKAIKP